MTNRKQFLVKTGFCLQYHIMLCFFGLLFVYMCVSASTFKGTINDLSRIKLPFRWNDVPIKNG